MWIEDYLEAVAAVQKYMPNYCWERISCSAFGSTIVFKPTSPDWYVVYVLKTKELWRTFEDTWRNPDHKELINDKWSWGA